MCVLGFVESFGRVYGVIGTSCVSNRCVCGVVVCEWRRRVGAVWSALPSCWQPFEECVGGG